MKARQIRWPPELWARIEDRCRDLGVRPAQLVRSYVKRGLDRSRRRKERGGW